MCMLTMPKLGPQMWHKNVKDVTQVLFHARCVAYVREFLFFCCGFFVVFLVLKTLKELNRAKDQIFSNISVHFLLSSENGNLKNEKTTKCCVPINESISRGGYTTFKYFNTEVKQHISCFHSCLNGTVGSIAEVNKEKKNVSSLT